MNIADGATSRVTFDRDGHDANWSADGKSIAYTTERGGLLQLHRLRIGASTQAESLYAGANLAYSGIWFRDESKFLTVGQGLSSESNLDIALAQNGGRGPLTPVVATRFVEQYPALSPDNTLLAYVSNRSGRDEVYLRRLAGGDDEVQVSVNGGREPAWGPDGRELFYRGAAEGSSSASASLILATIQSKPALAVASRRALFSTALYSTSNPHSNYDVSPDGKSFAFVKFNPSARVMIIQNLPALVARLRAAAGGER